MSASKQQDRHHGHAQARDRMLDVAGAINRRNEQDESWQVTGMKPKWIGNLIPGGGSTYQSAQIPIFGGVDA